MNAAVAIQDTPPLVPRAAIKRDRGLPVIIAVSLLVHAIALTVFLRREDAAPAPPLEIPIELVQLPKPPVPSPPSAKPARTETPAPRQARAAPPKPSEKPATRKPPAPRPAAKPAEAKQPKPQESVAERMKDLLGPTALAMPVVAMPGESADGTDAASYSQLVLSKIAKAKKEGRQRSVPGYSSVAFSLGVAGQVVSASIVRSSGDPSLDEEAIAMVHRGEPYPPPPVGGRRDYAITLVFRAISP